ncbi:M3 family oligoendopeptidase [Anaerocolumna aminovalerica]|jgi:pepF/M3 family oligoendopeptidase|uniref:Oligoendopeptidase, pepF/M3 family n=1 Tax=Anaerocolumna aminovalerica TaxID=1527 RepID=A0A1I5GLL0_9FIRM|nr:M3 family oligoendopeptidase [Anaerocolumna aminovalerica]MDU6262885.1 M3 family oligoendopeptidase [Anaerocolumna aminovalerica]SFO36746.1 oligoendopeptidase, pepF/M3 family [Anaerocolumna aminovalerica]
MKKEWSLDALYKGYQDEAFQNDFKQMKELITAIKDYVGTLADIKPAEALISLINYLEKYELVFKRLYVYLALRQSTNTTDSETAALIGRLEEINSTLSKEKAMINKYIGAIPNLDQIISENEKLKNYDFMLHEIRREAKHTLSDDVEEVIAKMNLSAGSAWAMLHQYLTSTVAVDYNGEETTLSGIRNQAYDPDQRIRKTAYDAEIAAYHKIKDAVAFSLNNIKSQVNTIADLRGYESPLAMTLENSRMKKETLDAMLTAMKEYMPKFHAYLRKKAEILGHKNGLPWYDLFAPLGESNRTFTTEEAKEYLVTHFRGFSDDLADLIETAFDDEWIDFFPHQGKVGGAFCYNLPFIKQSRILTNFDNTLSDVVTLAHELGHAYHGYNIQDHQPLNTDYSMPVAETASNFNELIIMNAAINESEGKEKLALLESQLQDTTQIICDIYSRYLFESAVFEKRKDSFLFADELENIMIEAQKEAYGDGLDHSCLHPYMWVCKGHYYSEVLSFYNFPYAFGGLFARGLYAKYQEEGAAFVPQYRDILKATTVKSVEDVAAMAGIDLTSPDFWRKSLQTVADSIDVFLQMSM